MDSLSKKVNDELKVSLEETPLPILFSIDDGPIVISGLNSKNISKKEVSKLILKEKIIGWIMIIVFLLIGYILLCFFCKDLVIAANGYIGWASFIIFIFYAILYNNNLGTEHQDNQSAFKIFYVSLVLCIIYFSSSFFM